MKRLFIQFVAQVADRDYDDPPNVKSIFLFLIPIYPIIFLSVYSHWFLIDSLWFIFLSLFASACYFSIFLTAVFFGTIRGAKQALKDPRAGETWIEIKDDNEVLWEGKKFIAPPAKSGSLPISSKRIEVPSRYADWQQWHDAYFLVILPGINDNKSPEEIITDLGTRKYPSSEKSYRKIRKAGDAGKLEKWAGS